MLAENVRLATAGNEAEPAGAVDAPDADVGLLTEPEVGGPQACVDIVGDLDDLVRAELAGGQRHPVERPLESLYECNLAGLADSLNVVERGRACGGCRAEPGLVDLDGDQPDRVDQVCRDVRADHAPAGVGHLAERHGVNPSRGVLEHDPEEDQRVEGLGVDPELDAVGALGQLDRPQGLIELERGQHLGQGILGEVGAVPGVEGAGVHREVAEPGADRSGSNPSGGAVSRGYGLHAGDAAEVLLHAAVPASEIGVQLDHAYVGADTVADPLIVAPVEGRADGCGQHADASGQYEQQHQPRVLERVARHVPHAHRDPDGRAAVELGQQVGTAAAREPGRAGQSSRRTRTPTGPGAEETGT